MFVDPIKFFFTKSSLHERLNEDFQTIAAQLGVYADTGYKLKKDQSSITITYDDTGVEALLAINLESKLSDTAVSSQITLTCEKTDNVSVNLLRGIIKGMGYRVYNPILGSYAATDPNLMDLTTAEIETQIFKIFKIKKLVPLFRYINSLVFYARNPKDGSIHLTNRHLIQSAIEAKVDIRKADNFSVSVAPDLATFIALSDRGLIPTAFYPTLFADPDLVLHANFSGFDLNQVNCDIYLSPVFFYLNRINQSFESLGQKKSISVFDKINQGQSLKKYVQTLVKKHRIGPLLAVKYPGDTQFHTDSQGNICPRINISVFVDQR